MKAVVLHGAGKITVEDRPKPSPKLGEALIKVTAAGICGSDSNYFTHGRLGDKVITSPYTPGHEISGIVEEIDANERGIKVGVQVGIEPSIPCGKCEFCHRGVYNLCTDLVFLGSWPVNGGMSEYIAIPVENIFPLPEGFTTEEGVLIETFSVGIHALDISTIKLADTVAIFGSGSIGLSHLQLALLAGASSVYVVDNISHRLDVARDMGASAVINAGEEDAAAKIIDLTGGRGVDVAFDCANVPETPNHAMESLARNGIFVFTGIVPTSFVTWDTERARRKGLTIKLVRRSRHGYERALKLAEQGRIDLKPFITHRFPIEESAKAYEVASGYLDNVIKAVIIP